MSLSEEVVNIIEIVRNIFGRFESKDYIFLNLIETLVYDIREKEKCISELEDKIKLLKGEQEKPKFTPPKKNKDDDISSEKERKVDKPDNVKKERVKRKDLPFHETKVIDFENTDSLPEDLEYRYTRTKTIQGIEIQPYNVKLLVKVYYSKTTGKCYSAPIPSEYSNGYTTDLKVLVVMLYRKYQMTESNIHNFLNDNGTLISTGTISNIILEAGKELESERDAIFQAGLECSDYIQSDTTGCKEKGHSKQVHNFNSPLFSAFYTRDDRKRATIIDILRNSKTRIFLINEEFISLLEFKEVADKHINYFKSKQSDNLLNEDEIKTILSKYENNTNLHSLFFDLAYITAFHSEFEYSKCKPFMTDDASVYELIFEIHMLCWIHEGRHFKKLNPMIVEFQDAIDNFLTEYWNLYHALLDYKESPDSEKAILLEKKFDALFSKTTCYDALNDRIALTVRKKEEMLVVLKYPFAPLHNNESELDARKIARFRDISLHNVTKEGTKARDVLMTIIETAKKLGVKVKDYLRDRLSKKFQMDSLESLIRNYTPP